MEVASIMVYICIPHLLIIMYISNAIIMVVGCGLFFKKIIVLELKLTTMV